MEVVTQALQNAVLQDGVFLFGFGPLSGLGMVYQVRVTCRLQRCDVYYAQASGLTYARLTLVWRSLQYQPRWWADDRSDICLQQR